MRTHTRSDPQMPCPWARLLWSLALLLVGAVPPSAAQGSAGGEVPVQASLREAVVRLGGTTTLTLVVSSDVEGELAPVPPVAGLELLGPSGPSVSTQVTIVNGRRSVVTQQSWRWQVRPQRTGEFELPPLSVRLGGETYTSEPLGLVVVEDLAGQSQGFLDLRAPAPTVVEGQPFELEITFGWDGSLGRVNYASLSLPWWENQPGVLQEVLPPARDGGQALVNGRWQVPIEALPNTVRDGRPFKVYRLRLEVLAVNAGPLEFAGNFLEYAELERDFFGTASKRQSAYARGSDLALTVRPLPQEGQPFDFGGAIGAFQVRATADTRSVRVGESIKLTVDWTGPGNLHYFTAPDPGRLPGFADFRSFGFVEEKVPGRRRVVYDLAPLRADVDRIPPLGLPYFDPNTWSYGLLETDPIPLRVEALVDAVDPAPMEPRASSEVHGIRTSLPAGGEPRGTPTADGLKAVAGAVLVSWLALRTAVRKGGVDPAQRPERRRRRAFASFARAIAHGTQPEHDLAAWVAFAADRTGEDPRAWLGRDVQAWGQAEGRRYSPYVIEELAQTARALEVAAYGGGARVPRAKLIERAKGLLEEGF